LLLVELVVVVVRVFYFAGVNLPEWTDRAGVPKFTACRWFREGTLPVPAERAAGQGVAVAGVVVGAGPGMNRKRRGVARMLADATATTVVVEHRDRLARFGVGP
jgi:putative resolvase